MIRIKLLHGKRLRAGLVIGLILLYISLALPVSAFADLVGTTVGPVDGTCVHEVPNGARIDGERGDVSLNGKIIAHYDSCAIESTSTVPSLQIEPSGGGAGGGGWYEGSTAFAPTIQGLTQFNYISVSWTVPSSGATDGSVLYLFPGLENLLANGNWVSIIQPIIQWGNNNINGGSYWLMEDMAVVNNSAIGGSGRTIYFSNPVTVSTEDTIVGTLQQTGAHPDAWAIAIQDMTSNQVIEVGFSPGSTWPKYNFAQMGILEGYGNKLETIGLNNCGDLPASDNDVFILQNISAAGPNWNTGNSVSPTWTAGLNASLSPQCSYNAQEFSNFFTTISWTN
jgi:hypothetical protein